MGAPYNPPIKGEDFVVYVALSDLNVPGAFKAAPTIVAGDFKVDKDGAGLVNLTAIPTVTPLGSVLVRITLTATEMNADVVTLVGIDLSAPKEWADFVLSIPTTGPGDVELLALAGLTSAADQVPFFTGLGSASTATASLFSRGLWSNTTAAGWQTGLGLSGVYQVLDPTLTAFAGITGAFNAANKVPYFTGVDTFTTTTLSPFAITLIDDIDAPAMRATLLLGTAATQNTGIVGATIPILNVANTWDAVQAFKQGSTHGGSVTTGRMSTFANDGTLSIRYGNNAAAIPLALINTQAAATTLAYPVGVDFKHGVGEFIGARIYSNPTNDFAALATASATLILQYANAGTLVSGLSIGASLVTILQPLQVNSTMVVTGQASFTLRPTAPTAAPNTNNTQLATTGYVDAAVGAASGSYQPLDATLTAFAAISGAANKLPYFSAPDVFALADFSIAGRALIDDADNVAQRVTLGLGSAAVQNIGTSAATVPLLSTANTWALTQSFIAGADVEAVRAGRSAGQSILLYSGAGGGNNSIISNSSAAAAKPLIINATTDMANSAITGGSVSTIFQILGVSYLSIASVGIATSGVAGSFQGAGTINADAFFEGGVALSTKYQGTGSYQPLDPTLTAFAAVTGAANTIPYFTALDAFAVTNFTSYGRQLVDDVDATTARATLGLVIGTDVQPYSVTLTAWATKAVPTGVVVGTTDAQILTTKNIDASANTISNITTTMFAANVIDADAGLSANSNTRLATQAAVKSYADNLVTGLTWKASVLVATTANITLAGEQTIDGVLTSASRVLVKNQTTASQNGIYISAAGSWVRSNDANTGPELVSATVFVERGTLNGDTQWTCSTDVITLGTTNIVFAQLAGAGTYSAGTGLSLTGNQFAISDAELLALLGTTAAADKVPYYTSATAATTTTLTPFSRTLLDDLDAATWRATLLLGSAALADTGTSLHTVPFLDTFNTWSSNQIITLATAGAVPLQLISTEGGAAYGPYFDLWRNSISPVANDQVGIIRFRGQNSAAATISYGDTYTQIIDATAGTETSKMFFRNYVKGVQNNTLIIDVGGGVQIDEALFSPPSTGSPATSARLAYNVATFRGAVSTTVGAIVFHAPTTTMANMHRMRVVGYNYTSTGTVIDFNVSGYHGVSSGAWNNMECQHFGTMRPMVRWGQDPAGCNCLILGDIASSWTYPVYSIVEMLISHSGANDAYMQGWTVSLETDLSLFVTLTADLTLTDKGSQPLDPTLLAFAGITGAFNAADKVPYFTGVDTFSTTTLSPFARTLIDDLDAATMRLTLVLGTMATQNASAVAITGGTIGILGTVNGFIAFNKSTANGDSIPLYMQNGAGVSTNTAVLIDMSASGQNNVRSVQFGAMLRTGTTDNSFVLRTSQGGAVAAERLWVGSGMVVGLATGGDKGVGTVNSVAFYDDGVALTSKYAQLGITNTFTVGQTISVTTTQTALTLEYRSEIESSGPLLVFRRLTNTPASGDYLGDIIFYMYNSAATPAQVLAGDILMRQLTTTPGAENAVMYLRTMTAGAYTTAITLDKGVLVGAAAGGDKGTGTINTTEYYEDGVSLATKYAPISGNFSSISVTGNIISTGGAIITQGNYVMVDRQNDAATAVMYIQGDSGQGKQLQFRTVIAGAATARWILSTTTTPEATGDIGADFQLIRYSNAGAFLGAVMTATRSTGNVTFAAGVIATGALTATAGGLYVDRRGDLAGAYMYMYADVNQFTQLTMYSGSTARWAFFKNITPETGGTTGNGGADFEIRAYNNDGSSHGTPLSINRASCIVNFASGIAVQGPGINVSAGDITNTGGIFNLDRRSDGVSAIMHLRSPSASASYVYFDGDDGTLRWLIGKNTAAETGDVSTGTGGANFVIYGYDNNGSNSRNALAIYRDTMETHFAVPPIAPSPLATADDTYLATTGWVNNRIPIFTLRNLGLPTNATTECSAALATAITNLPNGAVLDGEGLTYKCDLSVIVITLKHNVTIQNMTLDFSDLPDQSTAGLYIRPATTPLGSVLQVDDSINPGERDIQMSSVSGISTGDWVFFQDPDTDNLWSSVHGCMNTEIHKIQTVYTTSPPRVLIYGGMYHTMADSATMQKITFNNNWRFYKVKIIGPAYKTKNAAGLGVRLEYFHECVIDGCHVEGFDYSLWMLFRCWASKVVNGYFAHGNSDLAFGVHCVSGSQDIIIANNTFEDLGQALDCGNSSGTSSGVNRHIQMLGNNFTDMKQQAISTHGSSDYVTIMGNMVHCDLNVLYQTETPEEAAAAERSSGFCLVRGINISIKNNRCINAGGDAIIYSNYVDAEYGFVEITGNELQRCNGGGIVVSSSGDDDHYSPPYVPGVGGSLGLKTLDISDNVIDGVYGNGLMGAANSNAIGPGIQISPWWSAYTNCKVNNNTVLNYVEGIRIWYVDLSAEYIDCSYNTVMGLASKPGSRGIRVAATRGIFNFVKCDGNMVQSYETPIQVDHVGKLPLLSTYINYCSVCNNGVEPYSGGSLRAINISSDQAGGMPRVRTNDNTLMASQDVGIRVRGLGSSGRYLATGNILVGSTYPLDHDAAAGYFFTTGNFP